MNTTTRTPAPEPTEPMPERRSRRSVSLAHTLAGASARLRRVAVTALVTALVTVVLAMFGGSGAHAMTVTFKNGGGQIWVPNYSVGCATYSYSSNVSVKGITVAAAPSIYITQEASVKVQVWKWNGANWGQPVGEAIHYNTLLVGGTSRTFPTLTWVFSGHGYYYVSMDIKWTDMYGRLIGLELIDTTALWDFNATYRYSGTPGYCWA